MRSPARLVFLLALAAAPLSACSSPHPAPPAGPAAPAVSASSSLRPVAVGQPFDVPGWRITVAGMVCGVHGDVSLGEDPAGEVCVVSVVYANTGIAPAWFTGQSGGGPVPTDGARGYDAQGRVYDFVRLARGQTNPGSSGTTDLRFAVAPGVRLVRVDMAGVGVAF